MSETSIASYRNFSTEELGRRQIAVLAHLIKYGPHTNRQLSERMGIPINCICPRVNELRKLGKVKPIGKIHDPITDRDVTIWGVN